MSEELIRFEGGEFDLRKLSIKQAWDLRDKLDEAREIVDQYINDEIRRLVKEGWTQARIAKEVGRSQPTVSRRMNQLGIKTADKRGQHVFIRASKNDEKIESAQYLNAMCAPDGSREQMTLLTLVDSLISAERGLIVQQKSLGTKPFRDPVIVKIRSLVKKHLDRG